MIFEKIYNDISNSFGSIWKFKQRGETLEIITPFATTSQKFVSVFLSHKEDNYIISDGGWISDRIYDNEWDIEVDCFNKIFFHYLNSFSVKEIKTGKNNYHFYKTTENEVSIPSLVLDMSQFIAAIVSATGIDFDKNQEQNDDNYKRFRGLANNFISSIIPKSQLDTNGYLDRSIKVNAIIRKTPVRLILVNYISGVSPTYFTNSMARASLMFEMADQSIYRDNIEKKISFVDDTAKGYTPASERLNFVLENRHSIRIDWSEKYNFESLLN